jgi:ATP-dependent Clp protease ATP-binding subunit ClpC
LAALHARKSDLEKFHGIRYSDESLELAISSADRYLPEFALPGKALEVLDAAGARLKLRNRAMPEEIFGAQKRLRLIIDRHETAIMNHEFEKARFYSDEVTKEEEILRFLFEKYKINPDEEIVVQSSDIQDVLARWAEYPFCP